MSGEILDYSPFLPPESKDEIIDQNFKKIKKILSPLGINKLIDVYATTLQAVTSASYVNITAFDSTFTSSGGLIFIFGYISCQNTTGNAQMQAALFLDGAADPVKETQCANAAGGADGTMPLMHVYSPAPGAHKLEMRAKTAAGTMNVHSLVGSTFIVLEFMR